MAFRSWMITQDWQGKQLDKDIIRKGNKQYSPDVCVFVDQSINLLLTDHGAARGAFPIGVCFNTEKRKFVAKLTANGNRKHLGYFNNAADAFFAYVNAKSDHVATIQAMIKDDRINEGLDNHMSDLVTSAFIYALPTQQAWVKRL